MLPWRDKQTKGKIELLSQWTMEGWDEQYGLRNHFWPLESVFLMRKSEKKGINSKSPRCPIFIFFVVTREVIFLKMATILDPVNFLWAFSLTSHCAISDGIWLIVVKLCSWIAFCTNPTISLFLARITTTLCVGNTCAGQEN